MFDTNVKLLDLNKIRAHAASAVLVGFRVTSDSPGAEAEAVRSVAKVGKVQVGKNPVWNQGGSR